MNNIFTMTPFILYYYDNNIYVFTTVNDKQLERIASFDDCGGITVNILICFDNTMNGNELLNLT